MEVVTDTNLNTLKLPEVGLDTKDYHAALDVSTTFERIDNSVLLVISQVFSTKDRRAINGFLFLAHFLRLAQIKQLSLFPDCDVAAISIQSVWALCTNPVYAWPFSYEATSKYLRLLCAIGLFCKPVRKKSDPVTYHFPLRPYYYAPENTQEELSKLCQTHNEKIYKSLALQRILSISSVPAHKSTKNSKQIVDFISAEFVQPLQVAAIAVRDILQERGIAIPRTALQLIAHAMSQVLLAENSSFPLPVQGNMPGYQTKQKTIIEAKSCESPIEPRPSGISRSDEQKNTSESASFPQHPLSHQELVDLCADTHTEFNSSNNQLSPKEIFETNEFNGGTPNESAIDLQRLEKVDFAISGEDDVLDAEDLQHDAAELSFLFEGNDRSIGHYTKLLRENPQVVRLAVVDAWMRSKWPDKGYKRMNLGGGWVTKRYSAYSAGEQPPAEFLAWAGTDYSYTQLKMIFGAVEQYQAQALCPRERVFPNEIILTAAEIADSSFWENGGAYDLETRGYLYVDMEGDLLSSSAYEQLRLVATERLSQDIVKGPTFCTALVPDAIEHARQEFDWQGEEEIRSYLAWVQPQVCTPIHVSQTHKLPQALINNIRLIEMVVDPLNVQVHPFIIPFTGKLVIGVQRGLNGQYRFLMGANDVRVFLAAHAPSYESIEQI